MDSGAFTTLAKHGCYPEPVAAYAEVIHRFCLCGDLLAAVAQDFMCEPAMLERTGMTVVQHQQRTIERYDDLRALVSDVVIMPVLQGYEPVEYVAHIRAYGRRLEAGMWVGVGSVCKRNGQIGALLAVLEAIHAERPDLRLHGFGIKTTALRDQRVCDLLYSADSMAWSFAARRQGRDSNDIGEAVRFGERIERQPVQQVLSSALSDGVGRRKVELAI